MLKQSKRMKHKKKQNRKVTEIILFLVLVGALSIFGIVGCMTMFWKQQVRHLTDEISKRVAILDSKIDYLQQSGTKEEIDTLLAKDSVLVRGYQLNFRIAPGTEKGFITDIKRVDGKPIKGLVCRELIRKMSKQHYVSDVDFTVQSEVLDNGVISDVNIRLNGKVLNLSDVCGS